MRDVKLFRIERGNEIEVMINAGPSGITGPTGPVGPAGPQGQGVGDMLKSENLSGLANYVTARNNLSVYSKTELNNLYSTSKITQPTLTINTDTTKFDIGSFIARFVNNYTDPSNPTLSVSTYAGATALIVTNLATQDVTFLSWDGTTIIQRSIQPTSSQLKNEVLIGSLTHTNRTSISSATEVGGVSGFDIPASLNDFSNSIGPINISGNIFSGNATFGLKINKSVGETFKIGFNSRNSLQNPNITTDLALTAPIFIYTWRNGSGGFNSAFTDTIIPGKYDDGTGGVLQPNGVINSNKWSLLRLHRTIQSNVVIIEYGQFEYNNLSEAIAGKSEPIVDNPTLSATQFRGRIAVKGGATDLKLATDALFIDAGKLSTTVAVGSAGTSTTTLQGSYDNSSQPQVTTDTTKGAVQLKRGSAADTDKVVQVLNGAGTETFGVTGAGVVSGSNLSGINTGDQTSIVGITGTKAQYNTSITDGDIVFVGDTTSSTNALQSATTTVNVSSSTAPATGQILTATSGTTATWQTPAPAGLTAYDGIIAGEQVVGNIFEIPLAAAKTFTKFKISLKTLPTGANFIVTTYKNGVSDGVATITTAQGLTNGLYITSITSFTSGVYVENDILTISVTQIGSTLSGSGLTFQLI